MNKKSQSSKLAAMLGQSQAVERPRNLTEPEPAVVKQELRKDVKPELRKPGKQEKQPVSKQVTVGAKIDEAIAHHWAIEAKRQRLPMSQVITKALAEAFGLPAGHRLNEDE